MNVFSALAAAGALPAASGCGTGSDYDIGFASSPGEFVTGGVTTTGATLRVHAG